MVKIRTAKNKGAQFEYDVQHNLKHMYPNIYRTAERGFQMEFDLHSESSKTAFECKRHAKLTFKQAEQYFVKLEKVASKERKHYLIFQNNRWPVLVMHRNNFGWVEIHKFEDHFMCKKFEKHPSTRIKKR